MGTVLRKLKTVQKVLQSEGVPGLWREISPRLDPLRSAHSLWNRGIDGETAFWDHYFETKGGAWAENFADRLNPGLPLQRRPAALLPDGAEAAILDVGAGPLTYLGKVVPGKRLHITAIDPLAGKYDAILAKHGITPLVRTEALAGEELPRRFPPDSFDLVFARNCLDHAYDPVLAIDQMVRVAKPGGHVLLEHHPNEAEERGYSDLHQWNFSTDEGGNFAITFRGRRTVNVTARLSAIADTRCDYVDNGERWLIVTIRKRPAAA